MAENEIPKAAETEQPAEDKNIPFSTVDDTPSVVLELIYQLKIKEVMSTSVITAGKQNKLRYIQGIMKENAITCVPITEDKKLLGLVTIADIVTALDNGHINAAAEEKMTRDLIVLDADKPLSFAVSSLNKYPYNHFPVVNNNHELQGIITAKNVISTLLVEMNREVLRLEKLHQKKDTGGGYSEMEFAAAKHDFESAGRASTEIKKALKKREVDPRVIRRVAIASYELEINLVAHSNGGALGCSIQGDKITIVSTDTGPGIPDINKALQEGWSTASEWVRSLGFGAGMGLANTKRVSDEFTISSKVGEGTTVRSVILFNSDKNESGV